MEISELLIEWNNIKAEKQNIIIKEEKIKNQIKAFLKEKQWNKYYDKNTDISISISQITKETIDKMTLKLLLNATDYGRVVKKATFERLNIITKDVRNNMKKLLR